MRIHQGSAIHATVNGLSNHWTDKILKKLKPKMGILGIDNPIVEEDHPVPEANNKDGIDENVIETQNEPTDLNDEKNDTDEAPLTDAQKVQTKHQDAERTRSGRINKLPKKMDYYVVYESQIDTQWDEQTIYRMNPIALAASTDPDVM